LLPAAAALRAGKLDGRDIILKGGQMGQVGFFADVQGA
jgi:hypothetical protein